ncbi:MAG TPA: N-acetyltransferase [Gemmatimonas aurantiaca]|uniref:N-acetyltransferase n=2 Tax=Gemmatimonas aurantiaca TaxID=173480 RepID=A0A3D4VAE6_9BACT|nr:N-acetyltransferase [Gemmatimonas aurantiaca]
MAGSDPWVTLGRTFAQSLAIMQDPAREVFLAMVDGERVGFVVLWMAGPFSGYLQSLCLAPAWRGRGIGGAVLALAEAWVFERSPNVFLCVSSFNPDARRLYERAGYTLVGELPEFMVAGHSEYLFRKTRGPLSSVQG